MDKCALCCHFFASRSGLFSVTIMDHGVHACICCVLIDCTTRFSWNGLVLLFYYAMKSVSVCWSRVLCLYVWLAGDWARFCIFSGVAILPCILSFFGSKVFSFFLSLFHEEVKFEERTRIPDGALLWPHSTHHAGYPARPCAGIHPPFHCPCKDLLDLVPIQIQILANTLQSKVLS